jgi:NADH-quinone oxidoreductase subunit H
MAVLTLEVVLLGYLIFAAGGSADRILVALLQIVTFLVKTTMMCFVYVWVRWTLPRFRYDQLQQIGWQKLMPLALLNIFITSAVIVSFG